jgi:SAM-dependent methyltransferase
MSTAIEWLDRALYPRFEHRWDDALFRAEVLEFVNAESTVLDLGAGAGIVPHTNFRGIAARVAGVDPDPRVLANPHLDEAKVGTAEAIPYGNDTFDVVMSANVLEHLADPIRVFAEVRRVLRPGGVFIAKTPNRNHYVSLIARTTPTRFHEWVNGIRGLSENDTFPTLYRANTEGAIRRIAASAGLVVDRVAMFEGRPEYLRMAVPFYLVGWVYERLVNRFELLAPFRIVLIARLRRPALE